MALPGRDKTFALENCRDLLRKLEREIDRFVAAHTDVEARNDLAFNIVVTAWHLCDWVFADLTPEQMSKLQIKSLADLQAVARKCRALHLCRQAAIASKHWRVTDFPDPNVAVITTATPISGPNAPRVPLYTAPSWYLYFIDGSDIQLAEDVFALALEFWTHFIYHNEICKDDPAA
ncbi:MAG TPA: hypothetical protein VI358_14405 [Pseudolabrys sp.]